MWTKLLYNYILYPVLKFLLMLSIFCSSFYVNGGRGGSSFTGFRIFFSLPGIIPAKCEKEATINIVPDAPWATKLVNLADKQRKYTMTPASKVSKT